MKNKGKNIKPHIGIFGRRNNGKSSFINALTQQNLSIVSPEAGTTTDPVRKSIEIPGVGPSVLIDTAGIDDTGELGKKRVQKSIDALKTVDLAIILLTDNILDTPERFLISKLKDYDIPYFFIHNKSDETPLDQILRNSILDEFNTEVIDFSTLNNQGNEEITNLINKFMPETAYKAQSLLGDIINKDDVIVLITPIDTEAPEGRMILPQVQVIRDILDNDAVCIVLKESEAESFIKRMSPKPLMVICDSQVFGKANEIVPEDIMLTSFSTVLARHKGDFENYIKGTPHINKLKDGDRVLILESCTHHVTCDDIGRIKIPRWLQAFTKADIKYDIVSGLSSYPDDIHSYAMVIQCGGCMITRKQLMNRLKPFTDAGIPVSNYGMTIAFVHGIFDRAVAPFMPKK